MPGRKQSKHSRKGLPWWFGLIIALVCIAAAGWFYLLDFKPDETQKSEKTTIDQDDYAETPPDTMALSQHVQRISNADGPSPENPWIALIIDDFGSPASARVMAGFLNLPFDLTFSIIPGNPKSISIGREVYNAGGEVFIHLPMEPTRRVAMKERDMVLVGMTPIELEAILDRVTSELPFAIGINNHMGSKASLDDPLLRMLAFELRKRSLVFVDSRTAPQSRALTVMESSGVPVLKRDVFLDDQDDAQTFSQRLNELLRIARRRGWGIGIAHARQASLESFMQAIPSVEVSGVRIVTAATLVNAVWRLRQVETAAADEKLPR